VSRRFLIAGFVHRHHPALGPTFILRVFNPEEKEVEGAVEFHAPIKPTQ
jgi:hypothetical protein